jgi:chromosome segregation ATPase
MSTPTPRTDAAWSASFEGKQLSAGQTARSLRDCSQQLERELTALTAERDHLHAQLRALTLICGTNDANKFETWIDRANARAERAEADLAAAKERLRSEAMDDYASIKNLQRELATERARLNHVLRNDWPFRDRKAIDAAMKEDAK